MRDRRRRRTQKRKRPPTATAMHKRDIMAAVREQMPHATDKDVNIEIKRRWKALGEDEKARVIGTPRNHHNHHTTET